MNSIEDYWPTLAGILAVMLGAVVLWPGEKHVEPDHSALVQEERPPRAPARAPVNVDEDEEERPRSFERGARGDEEFSAPQPSVEYREYLIPVPGGEAPLVTKEHTQDDPEVKKALSQVEIVLYESETCAVCKRAAQYFKHNEIRYSSFNVDRDPRMKEKARRLSGGSGVPVIVVDGEVLSGFSPGSIQSALTQAVKKRVGNAQL